jgi:hypothetical protein
MAPTCEAKILSLNSLGITVTADAVNFSNMIEVIHSTQAISKLFNFISYIILCKDNVYCAGIQSSLEMLTSLPCIN